MLCYKKLKINFKLRLQMWKNKLNSQWKRVVTHEVIAVVSHFKESFFKWYSPRKLYICNHKCNFKPDIVSVSWGRNEFMLQRLIIQIQWRPQWLILRFHLPEPSKFRLEKWIRDQCFIIIREHALNFVLKAWFNFVTLFIVSLDDRNPNATSVLKTFKY